MSVIALALIALLARLPWGSQYISCLWEFLQFFPIEGRTIAGLGQHILDHLQSPILISYLSSFYLRY